MSTVSEKKLSQGAEQFFTVSLKTLDIHLDLEFFVITAITPSVFKATVLYQKQKNKIENTKHVNHGLS